MYDLPDPTKKKMKLQFLSERLMIMSFMHTIFERQRRKML